MTYIRPLSEVTLGDLPQCGGKAAYLGQAVQLGCPVLEGVVLTTELYKRFMRQGGLQGEIASILATMQPTAIHHFRAAAWAIREAFKVRRLPDEVAEAIGQAWRMMAGVSVVVRASATNEGSPQQSFVGQYFSRLDVPDEAAAIDAILECWTSLFDARALSYAYHFGINLLHSCMAVLIQRKIAATSRGALFTADPISGSPDVFVLEVLEGPRRGVHRLDPYQRLPGEPPVWTQLRRYGLLLDEQELAYQAIEWAVAEGQVHLLRVRPATRVPYFLPTLPGDIASGVGPFHLVQPVGTTPRAMRPYSWYHRSRSPRLSAAYYRDANNAFLPHPGRDAFYVRGYLYIRWHPSSPLAAKQRSNRLAYLLFSLRRLYAVRHGDRDFMAFYRDNMVRLDQVNRMDLSTVAPRDLSRVLREVAAHNEAFYAERGRLGDVEKSLTEMLLRLHRSWVEEPIDLRRMLQVEEAERSRFEADICSTVRDPATTEVNLEDRFQFLFRRYRHLFLQGDPLTEEQDICALREDENAARAVWRSWLEDPDRFPCPNGEQVARDRAQYERQVLVQLDPLRALIYRRVLQLARRYLPLRMHLDEPVLLASLLERDIVREVGRRLQERELVESPEDACLLGYGEIIDWLERRISDDNLLRLLVERRELCRRWWRYSPPETIELDARDAATVEGPPYTSERLPVEEVDRFQGLAVSPGQGRGQARLVNTLGEITNVLPGEVLLMREPLFDASPLFSIVSAVVSETGGLLDHEAVLAREYGVPAVFGVAGITEVIRSGEAVYVDATRGMVVRTRPQLEWELL